MRTAHKLFVLLLILFCGEKRLLAQVCTGLAGTWLNNDIGTGTTFTLQQSLYPDASGNFTFRVQQPAPFAQVPHTRGRSAAPSTKAPGVSALPILERDARQPRLLRPEHCPASIARRGAEAGRTVLEIAENGLGRNK